MKTSDLPYTFNNPNSATHNFLWDYNFVVSFREGDKIYYAIITSYTKYIIGGGYQWVSKWWGGFYRWIPYRFHPIILNNVRAVIYDSKGVFIRHDIMNDIHIVNWSFTKATLNVPSNILTTYGTTHSASNLVINTNG